MSDRERPQPPDLRRQVAVIGNDRDTPWSGGIPTAVSVVLVRDGVWRAVAEIGCSHPGIMWSGPPREEWKQAQTDREDYLTAQTVENGHLLDGTPAGMFPGGKISYTPVDALPEMWVAVSAARFIDEPPPPPQEPEPSERWLPPL